MNADKGGGGQKIQLLNHKTNNKRMDIRRETQHPYMTCGLHRNPSFHIIFLSTIEAGFKILSLLPHWLCHSISNECSLLRPSHPSPFSSCLDLTNDRLITDINSKAGGIEMEKHHNRIPRPACCRRSSWSIWELRSLRGEGERGPWGKNRNLCPGRDPSTELLKRRRGRSLIETKRAQVLAASVKSDNR